MTGAEAPAGAVGTRGGGGDGAVPAFGALLRGHRRAAGLTQEALAERAGLSRRGLQHLEAGDAHPHPATLDALAAALDLAPDDRARLRAAGPAAPPGRAPAGFPDGPPGARPPPAAAAPSNLPAPLTSFVGRERELAAVAALLGAHRLVTLTGPGGTGKTRLALQAAADALEQYPDGVWLAELAALADPGPVPHVVAAAVGVREEPGRPLLATLTDALRPRRLLLLLDNCEHLVDACARLADALLRACPRLVVLATSREPLGIAGETVWRVPSLPVPGDGAGWPPAGGPSVDDLAGFAAVRLFCERAAAVQPGFALDAESAPAVAQVCAQLDGIPLAIELAAARVRVLPPRQLLGRLEDRFRLLTGGSRTALERHQTLQAALDWSYDLLTPAERTLFARLAVFAGGFTLEAAEAVGAGAGIASPAVLDLLTRLVDQSLVGAEAQPDGTARYRLLETLRQYARQRLAAGAGAGRRYDRHAAHYLALAEEAEPRTLGAPNPDAPAQLARLEAELDNLRAALRWWAARGRAEPGLRLAGALTQFWYRGGHLAEGRAWLATFLALPAPPAAGGRAARSARLTALGAAGELARHQGDHAAAGAHNSERLALARALGDRAASAQALIGLGLVAFAAGDRATAGARFEESLALAPGLAPGFLSGTLAYLALVAQAQGDRERARARFEEALRVSPTNAARWGRYYLAIEEGDFPRARALEPAMATQGTAGRGAAIYVSARGALALAEGDHARARELFGQSLAHWRASRDHGGIAFVLAHFAALAAAEGRSRRAARLAGAAAEQHALRGGPRSPVLQAHLERLLAQANRGAAGHAHAAAAQEGRAMTLEQAVADALEDAREAP
jgi:non-specific serine/threonine protein kinase